MATDAAGNIEAAPEVADATTTVTIPAAGTYKVFLRTKDWVARWQADGAPGKFQVIVNGAALAETFGTQGAQWGWQEGGSVTLPAAGPAVPPAPPAEDRPTGGPAEGAHEPPPASPEAGSAQGDLAPAPAAAHEGEIGRAHV